MHHRWKLVPTYIRWTVWKERNLRCFEDEQNNLQDFKMKCRALFYFWCKQNVTAQAEDIFDVLDYLQDHVIDVKFVRRNTFEGGLHFNCSIPEDLQTNITVLRKKEKKIQTMTPQSDPEEKWQFFESQL